ncbi:MAG: alpha-hydroxy acid oxidase [Betaproteobacteria bacterium]
MNNTAIARAINIADLARLAKARLPGVIFDFLDGGAEQEATLRDNRAAFERYRLRPAMLSGHATRDLSVTLFGHRLSAPFLIGPTGLNGIFWTDADLALARAAAAEGVGFTLSSPANNSLEQVAGEGGDGIKFFQLYCWDQRPLWARQIERAQAAGYKALIVTVDSVVNGKRERDLRNRFSHEVKITPRVVWDGLTHPRWLASVWLRRGMPRMENIAPFLPQGASAHELVEFTRSRRNLSLNWADIAWMRTQWRGPLLVKGLLTAEDAKRAQAAGCDGVVVSNHGGRQLDGAAASIDVLSEVVAAVGGSMTILIDSGFRRGSDIVKALALGADGVLLGRATLYGVAAGGQQGAARALAILRDETDRVMTLLGCGSVAELNADHIMRM